jgi:hypothetical protein
VCATGVSLLACAPAHRPGCLCKLGSRKAIWQSPHETISQGAAVPGPRRPHDLAISTEQPPPVTLRPRLSCPLPLPSPENHRTRPPVPSWHAPSGLSPSAREQPLANAARRPSRNLTYGHPLGTLTTRYRGALRGCAPRRRFTRSIARQIATAPTLPHPPPPYRSMTHITDPRRGSMKRHITYPYCVRREPTDAIISCSLP